MLIIKNSTPNPSFYESLSTSAFNLVKGDIMKIITKAYTEDSIGRKDLAKHDYEPAADYHYLIFYCLLIRIYIKERIDNNLSITYTDLNTKYSIDCIINTLGCRGIKAQKIFDQFGINKDLTGNPNSGISYFGIELGDHIGVTPFIVRKEL